MKYLLFSFLLFASFIDCLAPASASLENSQELILLIAKRGEVSFQNSFAPLTEKGVKTFLQNSSFFSKEYGKAFLNSVSFTKDRLTLTFHSTSSGPGFCLLPPLTMNGVMIVLPAFRYTFSSPPPLIFDESLLDIMGHPIVHTSFAPMEEAFQHLLFYQQEQYIKRQYNRLLVLNGGLLLVVVTWLLAAFLKRHRLKRKEKEQEKREQAVSKRLIQVMKEGKIDWPLLHVRLVILAQKKSGQKKEMTALELQSYFLSIHEERPAEAARLLQAHGYLESEEMKPFQAACSCII